MAFKNYSTKKNESELKYEVIEKFGVLDSDSKMPKELRLIKWGNNDPKYDLRPWGTKEDGTETCGKGITLDAEELQSLFNILEKINKED